MSKWVWRPRISRIMQVKGWRKKGLGKEFWAEQGFEACEKPCNTAITTFQSSAKRRKEPLASEPYRAFTVQVVNRRKGFRQAYFFQKDHVVVETALCLSELKSSLWEKITWRLSEV